MILSEDVWKAKEQKEKRRGRKPKGEALWHHNVYVIELDPKVLKDRQFRAKNKGCDPAKPCFYVGSTGLAPEQRFKNHKRGYKANRYARRYGLRLRPDLYAMFNPMPWEAAVDLEAELAVGFREQGHGVWQA
jgi:hypothetical protein